MLSGYDRDCWRQRATHSGTEKYSALDQYGVTNQYKYARNQWFTEQ